MFDVYLRVIEPPIAIGLDVSGNDRPNPTPLSLQPFSSTGATLDTVLIFQLVLAIIVAFFLVYNLFHYALFLLVTHPKDARNIGARLNHYEQRQLLEWTPQSNDFLKHDDEKRTYAVAHIRQAGCRTAVP